MTVLCIRLTPDLERIQIARIRQRRSKQFLVISDVTSMTEYSDPLGPPAKDYPISKYQLLLPDTDDFVDTARIETLALRAISTTPPEIKDVGRPLTYDVCRDAAATGTAAAVGSGVGHHQSNVETTGTTGFSGVIGTNISSGHHLGRDVAAAETAGAVGSGVGDHQSNVDTSSSSILRFSSTNLPSHLEQCHAMVWQCQIRGYEWLGGNWRLVIEENGRRSLKLLGVNKNDHFIKHHHKIQNWFQNRRATRKQEKKQEAYEAGQAQEAMGYSDHASSPEFSTATDTSAKTMDSQCSNLQLRSQ
ncbi:hypothetical protein B0J14DRAFT_673788 [Halenospora varia]|nr:hypothetical protein B0J14DRAFT_673788 [Halenospora varia]